MIVGVAARGSEVDGMIIRVEQIGFEGYRTELFHLIRTFYEKVDVTFERDAECDAILVLQFQEHMNKGELIATLMDDGQKIEETVIWAIQTGMDAEQQKRLMKRSLLKVVLSLFRKVTGLEQPWGVLTGVRPTKLMHNLLAEHGSEEAVRIMAEEYLVTPGKVELLHEVARRQLAVLPDLFHLDREVSIYIGIPFCPTKCAYCTFPAYDIRGNNGSVEEFLQGLDEEIREIGAWLREKGLGITTIYWGGGTPTSIEAEQMDALFQTMHESFPDMNRVRELTVEAGRPDTITPDKIEVMKRWNVDRISINPQSFKEATLEAIGRHHTVAETIEKFHLAREMGLTNINMDLIIGLPGEDVETYERSLEETAKLMPESLTVHTLSFKRASKMTKERDQYKVAGRQEIEEMVRMTNQWTKDHGYVPYYLYRQKNILGNLENVGYSLPGKESLYNIIMMEERQTVIGLGSGAVSKIVWPAGTVAHAAAGTDKGSNDQLEGMDEGDVLDRMDGKEGPIVPRRIERMPNPKEPAAYNRHYKEYIDRKLRVLEEAYSSLGVGAETR